MTNYAKGLARAIRGFAAERRKVQYIHDPKIEVYVHPRLWEDFVRESGFHDPRRTSRRQRVEPIDSLSTYGPDDEPEMGDKFAETTKVQELDFGYIVEEPELSVGEVVMVEQGAVDGGGSLTLRDARGVEKIRLRPPPQKNEQPELNCTECGTTIRSDTYVEGDDGEPFCQLECMYDMQ